MAVTIRQRLPVIDLAEEPVALSVVEDDATGRVSFSDLPERLLPALIESFGVEAVDMVVSPTEIQREFFLDLPVSTRTRARYRDLLQSGELEKRVKKVEASGFAAGKATYFMAAINRSDESVLGRTGVIYFVCRKGCHFCQYRDFDEHTLDAEGIAARMLALQRAGADNIQWLSPTAYTPILVKALFLAAREGLTLPIVHKGEGEDPLPDLQLLDGLVDMYLPDVKFIRPEFATKIGLPSTYPKRMEASIKEMVRQVGLLTRRPGANPIQGGGVLVRHLLMPGGAEEAKKVLDFLNTINQDFPIRILTNYEPLHDAKNLAGIDRKVTRAEIDEVVEHAHELEMHRVLVG